MARPCGQLRDERIAVRVRVVGQQIAREGISGVRSHHIAVTIRYRSVVDRDGHCRDVAVQHAVVRHIGESVDAVKACIRPVNERVVEREKERAMLWARDWVGRQRIAIGVGVITQHC